jgi:hypothetical protein
MILRPTPMDFAASDLRIMSFARESRDITVPMGIPSIPEISA